MSIRYSKYGIIYMMVGGMYNGCLMENTRINYNGDNNTIEYFKKQHKLLCLGRIFMWPGFVYMSRYPLWLQGNLEWPPTDPMLLQIILLKKIYDEEIDNEYRNIWKNAIINKCYQYYSRVKDS